MGIENKYELIMGQWIGSATHCDMSDLIEIGSDTILAIHITKNGPDLITIPLRPIIITSGPIAIRSRPNQNL